MAGDQGNVHIVNSKEDWDMKLLEAFKHQGKIVVVYFTATWCGPCRIISPVFAELSKKYDQLVFLKVDVDELQEVSTAYEVRAMPTFLFLKDGELLYRIVGANKEELEKRIHFFALQYVSPDEREHSHPHAHHEHHGQVQRAPEYVQA